MHDHEITATGPALGPAQWLVLLVAAAMVLAYLAGVQRLAGAWRLTRLSSWCGGWTLVAAAQLGQWHDFAGHMVTHLVTGMVAPLLLVVSAPVTLLLRALPVARARPVARLLASRPAGVLTHPVTAALLNVGGLWLVYRTDLYAASTTNQWVHLAVTAHVVAAGYLFTFAVLGGPDPAPHRAPIAWRAGTLVAAVAAHNILAKTLYGDPPAGVPVAQAEHAAQLMYYGGVPVEIVLIVLVCRAWLAPTPTSPAARGRGTLRTRGPASGSVRTARRAWES